MTMQRLILFLLSFLFLCSCTQQPTERSIKKFVGRQITLSPDCNAIWRAKDTVLTDFTKVPVKLVVWCDSLACASCEISYMNEWHYIAAYADSLSQWFSIIYLFSPKKKDYSTVRRSLRASKFDYPIFIDRHATFVKLNPHLPKNRLLHSFLLDKNNKVVMVGNPLHNPSLWALYKRTIQQMIDNDGVLPEPSQL